MKKLVLIAFGLFFTAAIVSAQDEDDEKKGGFKKENLFTGGGVSLGLGFNSYGNTFSIGASPVFGYNITKWLDAGIVVNYIYSSYKNYPYEGYKVKISNYGGGVFTKIYPIRFIYLQAQYEHNFGRQKQTDEVGNSSTFKSGANSFLIGGGYASNRDPMDKRPFFYIGLMADVSGDVNSPYVNANGDAVPMIWTGLQIPLFQGRSGRY
ncbi:MAG: hypothetical protein WDN26_18060 [Chitinophagaceae bacterium]